MPERRLGSGHVQVVRARPLPMEKSLQPELSVWAQAATPVPILAPSGAAGDVLVTHRL